MVFSAAWWIKLLFSAALIATVAEIAKQQVWVAAALKALPLVSLLSLWWLYRDTGNVQQVAAMSEATLWLVLPTLPFFYAFPWLLRHGWGFYAALSVALTVMFGVYALWWWVLARWGIRV